MDNRRVFIRNLPAAWDEYDVFRLFDSFGVVCDVRLPAAAKGACTRYGFVEMKRPSEASGAVRGLNGKSVLETVSGSTPALQLPRPLYAEPCRLQTSEQPAGAPPPPPPPPPLRPLIEPGVERPKRADPEKFVLRDQSNLNIINTAPPADKAKIEEDSVESWSSSEDDDDAPPPPTSKPRLGKFNMKEHAAILVSAFYPRSERLPFSRPVEVYVESRRGAQSVKSPADLVLHVADSAAQLHQLTERMQHRYRSSEPVAFYPQPNEVVAVRWRPLGGWLRAVVCQSVKQQQEYRCRLLDFGCEVRVPQWEVRPIDRKLLDVAAQAIACSLANVAPLDDGAGWSDEARDAIRKLLTASNVVAVHARLVAYFASVSRVHLSITEDLPDGDEVVFDCADRLASMGLCRRVKPRGPFVYAHDELIRIRDARKPTASSDCADDRAPTVD